MKRRIVALLLALVMALGLCVTTAWADGVSYFDPTAIETEQNKTCPADYTLVTGSTGTEPVTWNGGTSDAPKWYVVDNDVTISGTVKITGHVNLILCDDKTLTVNGGIVIGGSSDKNLNFTIYGQSEQSGKLVAKGVVNDSYSAGINCYGNLTINGGVIEATGNDVEDGLARSYGIYVCYDLIINGGTVNATGGKATNEYDDAESCGIYVLHGDMTVKGGKVTANGGDAEADDYAYSYGICVKNYDEDEDGGNLTIEGGKVTANGGDAEADDDAKSCGIYVNGGYDKEYYGNLTIKGGRVNATGNKAEAESGDAYSYGIRVYAYLDIEDSEVIATGGAAEADDDAESYGIYVKEEDLLIKGGTVTATGGAAEADDKAESYGIYFYDELYIEYGTVIAETTADEDTDEKAAVSSYYYAHYMPDCYNNDWQWRTAKDGAYQGHTSFDVADFASNYFELIATAATATVPHDTHEHTRRQPGTTTTAPADSDKGTEDKSGVVTSANTFDAGVAVYAGLGVLSLAGSAWVARKKW